MFLPVLKKNESLSIMQGLLKGEVKETEEATLQYMVSGSPKHRDELAGEVLDVIQVCVGFLDKLEGDGLDLEQAFMKHLTKLMNRQIWTVKGFVKVKGME